MLVCTGEVTSDLSKLELRPGEEVLFNDLIEGYNEVSADLYLARTRLLLSQIVCVTLRTKGRSILIREV